MILLVQAKLPEAEDHYLRTVQVGDLAHAPDDVLDPVLRICAKILLTLKRYAEAESLQIRI